MMLGGVVELGDDAQRENPISDIKCIFYVTQLQEYVKLHVNSRCVPLDAN